MRLKILVFVLLSYCAATVHADDRLPIPDKAAQDKADELVKEIFGDEIAKAKIPDEKSALIKKLLEESAKPDTTSAGRYAILKAALVTAPDAKVAMSVIDEMAKHFQIEAMQAKAYTLKNMSAITPSERKALAESAVELAGSYTEQDNYEAALALIDIALEAATKSRDSQLIRDIRAKKGDVSSLEREYADAKAALATLETDPTDAKSNSVAGKYKCFVKGKWEDGLPMLALGDDEALKALATKELMGAKVSSEQVDLADGWYDVAETLNASDRKRVMQRASYWYSRALQSQPTLVGLVKAKVEKRIQEINATSDTKRPNFLELVDLAKHAVKGKWQKKDSQLMCLPGKDSRIMIPFEIDGSYDLNVEFVRIAGFDCIHLMLPVGKKSTTLYINGWSKSLGGRTYICEVKGRHPHVHPKAVKGVLIKNNKWYTADVAVRLQEKSVASIELKLDGRRIFVWQGPVSLLEPHFNVTIPDPSCVGIGAHISSVVFRKVEIEPLPKRS